MSSIYNNPLNIIHKTIQNTIAKVEEIKGNLSSNYSSDELAKLSQIFEEISKTYVDYTASPDNPFHDFILASNSRRNAVENVSVQSKKVAQLFANYSQKPRSYSNVECVLAITHLLDKLRNLMMYSEPAPTDYQREPSKNRNISKKQLRHNKMPLGWVTFFSFLLLLGLLVFIANIIFTSSFLASLWKDVRLLILILIIISFINFVLLISILNDDIQVQLLRFFERERKTKSVKRGRQGYQTTTWIFLYLSVLVFAGGWAFIGIIPPNSVFSDLKNFRFSPTDTIHLVMYIVAGISLALFVIISRYLKPDIQYLLSRNTNRKFRTGKGTKSKLRDAHRTPSMPAVSWVFYWNLLLVPVAAIAIASLFSGLTAQTAITVSTNSPVVVTVVITTTPFPTLTPVPTPTMTATPNITKTPTSTPVPNWVVEAYQEKRGDGLFWVVTSIVGLLLTYFVGVIALIISASRSGSKIFARSWLTRLASKPLSITPRLGRWALFLGYKERLMKQRDVERASQNYFGLPVTDATGKVVISDYSGDNLHSLIAKSVGAQEPLVIVARGGGGKTTLVARLAYLALKNTIPYPLTDYRPILVTSANYEGNLLEAISRVLRERDGLAIDKNTTRAQLESGNFLILFDGVSEVEGNQNVALKEMLETASHADYRECRFVFTTRPGLNMPEGIKSLNLQPLTSETIKNELIPRFVSEDHKKQILKHLDKFASKPIEPLLFSMLLKQSDDKTAISTRSQLYERYFRTLLLVDNGISRELGDWIWRGWKFVLGAFAKWMNLDSGYRGVGLVHETLIELLSKKESWFTMNSLLEEANFLYNFPEKDKFRLLDKLKASRILIEGKRLRFEHDTFEEFFAATYIIWLIRIRKGMLPDLGVWSINEAQAESFLGVIEFLGEMADKETLEILLHANLPELWKASLQPNLKEN